MQRNELIFHSIWTGFLGVMVLLHGDSGITRHVAGPWDVVLGTILLIPTALTVTVLTIYSDWFQKLVGRTKRAVAVKE